MPLGRLQCGVQVALRLHLPLERAVAGRGGHVGQAVRLLGGQQDGLSCVAVQLQLQCSDVFVGVRNRQESGSPIGQTQLAAAQSAHAASRESINDA